MVTARVKKRKVFYIPGYDPFPPRRYRELYRKESQEQARISGFSLRQAPLKTAKGTFGWQVHSEIDGEDVHTEIEIMEWSDLVRSSMSDGILSTYRQMVQTLWIYAITGALFNFMKLRRGPVITALYPIFMLSFQAVFATAISLLLVWILHFWIGVLAWVGLTLIWGICALFRKFDGKFFAYYLMHDYAHSCQLRGLYPQSVETRLESFRTRLRAALSQDYDEVLLIGHSSGAHLGVSVLADFLEPEMTANDGGPVLSFLTLGHVVPMMAFLPKATKLRQDLIALSQTNRVAWVDISAPADPVAFSLCDPVNVAVGPVKGKKWPLLLSAVFRNTLSPEKYRAIRFRFFRAHFQYLCAFDNPGEYDYFKITAGPKTLYDRFRHCEPSPSRIEKHVTSFHEVWQ